MREDFKKLINEKKYIEAAELFALFLKNRDFVEFDEELESVDLFLRKVLPFLTSHESVWLIKNPGNTKKFLDLTANAFERDYLPSDMIYYAMHLRCFLAIAEAMEKDIRGVHKEILYAADSESREPEEIEERPLSRLDKFLGENGITAVVLASFFKAYFDLLKEIGRADIIDRVGWIIEKSIFELEKEETRSGVVRGLFVSGKDRKGVIKNILVRIEEGEEGIGYSHLEKEKLGESIRDASDVARKAAHEFLILRGYPEGLSNRKVIWQIVRTNGKAEDMSVFYDGASICLPLAVAIISNYLNQPVASDIAMTGTFNIHSIEEGRVLGVAGIQAKTEIALESGLKKIFIPFINKKELDLAVAKRAEELGAKIISINRLYDVYVDLFYKPKPKSFRSISLDVWNGILSFLCIRKAKAGIKPDYLKYKNHLWLASGLYSLLYILNGFGIHFTYQKTSLFHAVLLIVGGTVVIVLGLIICFVLASVIIEREKRSSWLISLGITFACTTIVYFIFLPMTPYGAINLSKIYDWPPILGISKDFIIFWMFAAIFLTNIYHYVVGLNFLIKRRQFSTVRNCLRGQEESEAALPSVVIRFGWKEGLIGATFAAVLLIIFEMIYFINLSEGVEQAASMVIFGITRDIVFLIAAAEMLIWYKNVLSEIGKRVRK